MADKNYNPTKDLLLELELVAAGWRERRDNWRLQNPLNSWEEERLEFIEAAIARVMKWTIESIERSLGKVVK